MSQMKDHFLVSCSMSQMKDLYDFLVEAELQHYYNSFQQELKVTNVSQLKYVEDDDLVDMGMTKPEIRRLKKFFKKECPQGTFGKLKKVSHNRCCVSLVSQSVKYHCL